MLEHVNPENAIYIDIETVPMAKDFETLPQPFRDLWHERFDRQNKEGDLNVNEHFFQNAGIYAEYGKVICISVGILVKHDNERILRIRSFAGHDEKQVLSDFASMLNKNFTNRSMHFFCGHNINEFDIPFLCRRMLVNGIKLPGSLDISGLKPWEVKNIDTMLQWKFGDYKNFTSLRLLAALFDIPTPKDDISGKDVGKVYWHENNLERIVTYCQKDVLTVVRLLLKFKGIETIADEQVVFVKE